MISVLIERNIALDLASTYEDMAKKTLHLAYQAPGFINGETFSDISNPLHRFVLSKWRNINDWHNWCHSDNRKDMMDKLNLLFAEPEKVCILEN
jgi:heme-degrading monooxygenase HmoA